MREGVVCPAVGCQGRRWVTARGHREEGREMEGHRDPPNPLHWSTQHVPRPQPPPTSRHLCRLPLPVAAATSRRATVAMTLSLGPTVTDTSAKLTFDLLHLSHLSLLHPHAGYPLRVFLLLCRVLVSSHPLLS